MDKQWQVQIAEVRQALQVAEDTKTLINAIKEKYGYLKWCEKWESESDQIIASFGLFLSKNVPASYRFAAWIDVPQLHLNSIFKAMALFGVDIKTLYAEIHQVPEEQELVQPALF